MPRERSLIAGMTDYTGVALADILAHFRGWQGGLRDSVSVLGNIRKRLAALEADPRVYDGLDTVDGFVDLFERYTNDFERLLVEMPTGVHPRHIETVRQLYQSAVLEEGNCVAFKREYRLDALSDRDRVQNIFAEVYRLTRDELINMKDLSNVASRLKALLGVAAEASHAPEGVAKPQTPTVTAEQKRLLQFVYECFHASNEWPLAKRVDLALDDVLDPIGGLELVCKALGRELILCESPSAAHSRVRLPLLGILACENSLMDIEDFLTLARYAAQVYRDSGDASPTVDLGGFSRDSAIEQARAKRAFLVAEVAGRFWDGWSAELITLSRFAGKLAGVGSVADFEGRYRRFEDQRRRAALHGVRDPARLISTSTGAKDLGVSRGPQQVDARQYDVALSFAGEDRPYVDQVAHLLRDREVRVFYDAFETSQLWGKNLVDHFADLYQARSRFVVMFISKYYVAKAWPTHERQSAQAQALVSPREYILPARFDDSEVPGMAHTVGHVDLRKISSRELAELICKKLTAP